METVELSAAQKNRDVGAILHSASCSPVWWCCSTSSPSSRSARIDGLSIGGGEDMANMEAETARAGSQRVSNRSILVLCLVFSAP